MTDKSQDIISLISQYTSELESLDQLNNTYIMTCIGTIGVILSIIVAVISIDKKVWKTPPYRVVAPLFLSIPVVACVFLSVVTLNCRKVAMYRGYLVYLENSYNQIEGVVPQFYNSNTLQFLSKWWITNLNGSVMNRVVDVFSVVIVVMLFLICFICAYKAFDKTTNAKGYKSKKEKSIFYISFCLVIVACVIVSISCACDLIINNITVEKVLNEIAGLK